MKSKKSPVSMMNIIREEEQHLSEITEGLKKILHGEDWGEEVCKIETNMFESWKNQIMQEVLLG